ncbi:MAG: MBL fold metallo-hydrolase [Blautia sp.]|nr:MBL fold metallo-hydrolase [Blautia sp.]
MGKLKVEQYVVGPVQTNCYFVINEETKELLVIDPGAGAKQLAGRVREQELKPAAILLTHGHFDHAAGAQELAAELGVQIYIHEADRETLADPKSNVSWMMGEGAVYQADIFLKDGQELDLAGFHIRVLHTPGHTVGGACYYFPYEDTLFSGDTLFCGSVGRTDFEGGSMANLVRSIKEKLLVLPERTVVYTGHGEATTIESERMYNSYL